MKHFREYIKSIRAKGKIYFTSEEALNELHITRNALRCGMYKLKKKGDIISPAKNLYIIIPPEHQKIGSIPADELIPILMKHWKLPYYVCLLSAALYHGSSHQKPQAFQVMAEKQLKPLLLGKIKISFIYKKSLVNIPTQEIVVKSGYLKVATPESTVMDLLHYPTHAGGLNHIATVLNELIPVIDINKLMVLISASKENAWAQRLGYIIEKLDSDDNEKRDKIVNEMKSYFSQQKINFVPLASELPFSNSNKNYNWLIYENTTIESDI